MSKEVGALYPVIQAVCRGVLVLWLRAVHH